MSIRTEVKGAAYWITFDNAKRKNAISSKMYEELCQAMDEAEGMEETLLTVITGDGEYYSSGNDFSPAETAGVDHGDLDYEAGYSRFMRRLIRHTKVLVALVNGPAIGIAATTLGLFDYLVCSDSTYISTPFPTLGVCPEGTSSVVFERIMGTSNATEMLLFGEPMNASQALQHGFVSHVFPKAEFRQKAAALVEKFAKLPKHSVLASKELCRGQKWRREMLACHNEEYDLLRKLFVHEDTINLIMNRFMKAKV
ncbi:hypothetical protein PENTCL1PPCAC_29364 [Pristionchus entomophagus]|uniref:Ech-3 n=1 Tax=Pristionchus entomophagus TaxID=358040 RepID=A0AAV5UJG4_9BILA|nr:hypothetical protein PENTCL1PPCAC_29364 [Pristionchus entomophagus]